MDAAADDSNVECQLCGIDAEDSTTLSSSLDHDNPIGHEAYHAKPIRRGTSDHLPTPEERERHMLTHEPFRSWCPHCGSEALTWTDTAGRGTVYSYTVVHRPPNPVFKPEVPYAVAVVALEEGPHLMARIVGCPAPAVRIGMAVSVTFLELTEEISLPVFTPAEGS